MNPTLLTLLPRHALADRNYFALTQNRRQLAFPDATILETCVAL
jgi:hypothetical protein